MVRFQIECMGCACSRPLLSTTDAGPHHAHHPCRRSLMQGSTRAYPCRGLMTAWLPRDTARVAVPRAPSACACPHPNQTTPLRGASAGLSLFHAHRSRARHAPAEIHAHTLERQPRPESLRDGSWHARPAAGVPPCWNSTSLSGLSQKKEHIHPNESVSAPSYRCRRVGTHAGGSRDTLLEVPP